MYKDTYIHTYSVELATNSSQEGDPLLVPNWTES